MTRLRRLIAVWAALMLSAGAISAADGHATISKITVHAAGLQDQGAVLQSLALVVGKELDRHRLREGVHALFAGGEVEYLRVESDEGTGGVEVRVHLRLRSRINQLRVQGAGFVWQQRIKDWLEMRPGDPVSAARVEAGVARVLRSLRERGYAQATVDPTVDFYRISNTVNLTVDVHLGEVQRLHQIRIEGLDPPEAATALLPGIRKGRRLTRRLVERVRDEVEAAAREAGYWQAHVISVDRVNDGAQVELVLQLAPGPRYTVDVHTPPGAEEVVADALPDAVDEEVHAAQTAALAERIRSNLQAEGHLLPTVDVQLHAESEEEPQLQVRADPGPVRRISEVLFTGARSLSNKQLRATVRVKPGRTEGWRGRTVTDASLENDRAAVAALYRRHGFAEVEVAQAVLEADSEATARVSFAVSEGQRWLVGELRLEGLPVETAAALEDLELPLAEAAPWQPALLDTTRRRLEAALANTGYPAGRVEAEVSDVRTGTKQIVMRVRPGPYVSIGKVVIAGLEKTRTSVVERILERARVQPGEAYSEDNILLAQRLLYELGLFRRVEVVPLPGQEHRVQRGLVVRCEEGQTRSYVAGVGWDTVEDFRLTLGWSNLNLLGGAHAVSVEGRFSSRQLRLQAGLREAWLPLVEMPGYAVVYRTEEEYASYSQLRRGVLFELGDRRQRPFRHWYRYRYELVEPEASEEVLSELEREEQRIRVSSITPTVEWDARDDPLNPRRGFFASASLEWAYPVLSADAHFFKAQTAFSVYQPAGRGSFAAGLRLGAIEALADDTGEAINLQVPVGTRFFAGGQVTHRAFEIDTLGIAGETLDAEGEPIGGNGLLLVNLEYRRSISGPLSAALFVDGGNVWADYGEIRVPEMRWGVGLGLRYDTPAGPLRLEYGYKLDREPGESRGEVFLSFGTPF